VDPVALDAALKAFGFPVGPVSLMDEVGLDVSFYTFNTLRGALGDRMTGGNPGALAEMVERKMLGRKTGRGFFVYGDEKGKAGGARALNADAPDVIARFRTPGAAGAPALTADDMQQRMLLRFVKECILCAEDGILAPGNAAAAFASGDVGAVYGIGFPPFLGGPFRYCDIRGLQSVADAMQKLADTVGPHFAPPRLLLDLARAGKTFHAP
jgi:enoyl-CoA hydratase/long-chain 3-hydroxyacyl-CoA dehydrogenase